MTEVSFRVLKHFFFGRVEKLSVSPAHFTPVSGQLFRFYSADCRSNSSIITFRNQYFNESRSEEHTSELQSLMRISYAVFCLNKKNICDLKKRLNTQHRPDPPVHRHDHYKMTNPEQQDNRHTLNTHSTPN